MIVETTLEQAFNAYLNLAKAELRPQQEEPKQEEPTGTFPFQLLKNDSIGLRHHVERIETRSEFAELVKQTVAAFPPKDSGSGRTSVNLHGYRSSEIGNFFRRSRCYETIHADQDVDASATLQNLINQFCKEQSVRYLLPLSFIGFSDEQMEFDGFRIRRFSAEELNYIFEKEVSEVFYGWNDSNTFQVSEIENYWWIDFEEPVESSARTTFVKFGDSSPSVQDEFSAFPKEIERVLQPFILYDWQSDMVGLTRFEIPFVLGISNDLLGAPALVPNNSWVPRQFEGDLDYDVEMDDAQTASFYSFISGVDSILTRLRPTNHEWQFLEVSLLFLNKAFVSEDRLQRLLWYLIALEALLGENVQGLTNVLGRRLASILGKTREERKDIKESFDQIYDLRSGLVHGKEKLLYAKATYDHLHKARDIARQTVVWFLRYLDHVLDHTTIEELPNREELLSALDIKIENRERVMESNERVNRLLRILPADVPRPSKWFDK